MGDRPRADLETCARWAMSAMVVRMPWSPFAGHPPRSLGLHDGRLGACPNSPNCVSSEAGDAAHHVEPLRLLGDAASAWEQLVQALSEQPRTRIVTQRGDYLHAECSSPLLGFVDDLEIQLVAATGEVAVRCASRIGYSDLGVNRKRIDELRRRLRAAGIVE